MAVDAIVDAPSPVLQFSNYTGSVTGTGGTAPYTYVDSGSLPPGLNIDGGTGVISGSPTTLGSYIVDILVTDSLAATFDAIFEIDIVSPAPSFVRNGVQWKGDECLPSGRQMARLIADVVGIVHGGPSVEIPLEGSSNQPMGLIKSLIYSVKFKRALLTPADGDAYSFDVESTQNLMRVTLGVPSDALASKGGFDADVSISGAIPFYCDSTKPVRIIYTPNQILGPVQIDARLFFCNFEVDPYTLSCLDTWTD
jgi:Putative Ig domain